MSQAQVFQLIFLVILLCLSAFFSASETAIFSTNKVKIRHLAEEGNKRATLLRRMLEQPGRPISTILIGNNVVNIGSTAIATSLAISFFDSSGAGIATAIMSVLILIFGEITPKTLVARNPEEFSLNISSIINRLGKVLSPLIFVLNSFTNLLVKMLDGSVTKKQFITEEELRMLVNVGEEEGFIDEDEREMIDSIFEFNDTLVREVMVPRIDIYAVDVEDTLENVIKLVMKVGHSRIPVYEQTVDNIIGVVYAKDLLQIFLEPRKDKIGLKKLMRAAYYVPESKKVRDLFAELRKEHVHMAIVLDEYGGTAGLATIEDLIEEIVGEIQDEYDSEEQAIKIMEDGSFLVDARTPISEINEAIKIALSDDEYDTISGVVFHNLGRLPFEGEELDIGNLQIKIEKIVGRRLEKLRLRKVE